MGSVDPPRRRGGRQRRTQGEQEQHKRNTRGTQESTSQSPGLHLACTWLEVGFGRLCPTLLHSTFYILHSPRGGFGVACPPHFCFLLSAFCFPATPSAFTPQWLCRGRPLRLRSRVIHREFSHSWQAFSCARKNPPGVVEIRHRPIHDGFRCGSPESPELRLRHVADD